MILTPNVEKKDYFWIGKTIITAKEALVLLIECDGVVEGCSCAFYDMAKARTGPTSKCTRNGSIVDDDDTCISFSLYEIGVCTVDGKLYCFLNYRVPYYAPPPGFGSYSQGQQHPPMAQQMFGQIPQGGHPAQMPVSGMQPMPIGHMAPVPMPTMVGGTMPTSTAPGPLVLPSDRPPSKMNCDDGKVEGMQLQNSQQLAAPRACWTPVEEEVLVKTYAEYTIGKKLKKISRKTWEAITQKLFEESKKHIAQVSMKSWMQCKDKWNNMIKKHKLQKSEFVRESINDGNMREKSALYDAMENVLSYESGTEFAGCTDQDTHYMGEEDSVSMVVKIGGSNKGGEVSGHDRLSLGLEGEATQGTFQKTARNEGINAENRGKYEQRNQGDKRISKTYSNECQNEDGLNDDVQNDDHGHVSVMYPQLMSKRQSMEHHDNGSNKRARMSDSGETSVNEKLCQILEHQTELLERAHAQHCELMQQVRISEENTRMMVVQAIKDLGTILSKLIKSEEF